MPREWGTWAAVGGASTVFLLLVLGGWTLWHKGEQAKVPTDKDTLCPSDRPPAEVLAILLDVSEEFSEAQRIEMQNHLERLRNGLPRFGMVQLYAIEQGGPELAKPVLALCNPGTGQNMSSIYENPEMARRSWQGFAGKLSEEIRRRAEGPGAQRSPLFEAIHAIAIRTFGAPAFDGVPKQLVLVSDLLQNTEQLSMYRGIPDPASFMLTPYYRSVRSDLHDVRVQVLYLVRPASAVQGRTHVGFWERYLAEQGAIVESVQSIAGGS